MMVGDKGLIFCYHSLLKLEFGIINYFTVNSDCDKKEKNCLDITLGDNQSQSKSIWNFPYTC